MPAVHVMSTNGLKVCFDISSKPKCSLETFHVACRGGNTFKMIYDEPYDYLQIAETLDYL